MWDGLTNADNDLYAMMWLEIKPKKVIAKSSIFFTVKYFTPIIGNSIQCLQRVI